MKSLLLSIFLLNSGWGFAQQKNPFANLKPEMTNESEIKKIAKNCTGNVRACLVNEREFLSKRISYFEKIVRSQATGQPLAEFNELMKSYYNLETTTTNFIYHRGNVTKNISSFANEQAVSGAITLQFAMLELMQIFMEL